MSEVMSYDFTQAKEYMSRLEGEVAANVYMTEEDRKVMVGAICLGSAVLLEGVPGTGKTTIANTVAKAMGGTFGRIQGAPDLLPGDITGVDVYNPTLDSTFEFQRGPIFSNVLLVDEINRMSPKSQAAFLQGMQEKEVTVGNKTYQLEKPFIVLATQNPNEIGQGTAPLTKANLDRFPVSLELPALSASEMLAIENLQGKMPRTQVDAKNLPAVSEAIVTEVSASPEVKQQVADLIEDVRESSLIDISESVLGGARPLLQIIRHAKAIAMQESAHTVSSEHVDKVAKFVLRHRIGLNERAFDNNLTADDVVNRVLGNS